jgi:ABC-type bacteriocin/lantibiotic exporter with double-glycine peptidase domain
MSKNCREIEALLSAYLENDLSRENAAWVKEHLDACPACLAKKEKMEEIIFRLSDLQEEVPFFLKNRLYNIPETLEKKAAGKILYFPKWLAAAVGTVILFLNLFYFTNIFPPVNREMHAFVSSVEKIVVKTGGWFEKVKESKDLLFFTFFNKKSSEIKDGNRGQDAIGSKGFDKGGKNG